MVQALSKKPSKAEKKESFFTKYTDSKLDPDRFSRKNKNTTPTSKGGPNRAAQDLPEKKPSFRASQEVSLPEKKPVVKATVKKTVTTRGPSAGQKEADRLMEKYNTPTGVDPKYIKGTPHK